MSPASEGRTIAITGAAGKIGTTLRRGLHGLAPLRSIDVGEIEDPDAGEEVVQADIRDADAMLAALAGCDVVVHLAAIPTEAAFDAIQRVNIEGTYNVFEAARRGGVRRVVFASTIHVTGFYPFDQPVRPDDPVRPDTYYGVSKAFGEALARLYSDRHGIEVVCVRIGGFAPEPRSVGYLSNWLSPGDCVRLFRRCIEASGIRFLILYGISANTRRVIANDGWDVIGYQPLDDAETYAGRFQDADRVPERQGMRFATREGDPR